MLFVFGSIKTVLSTAYFLTVSDSARLRCRLKYFKAFRL
jgi:hypothetical protein